MGLRKLIRKVTRPVSRVLDKIIPNEIKPALPYLAAAAPVLGPQMGILGNLTKLQAAGLYGGGALAAQLAQEGSEGDFDLAPILAAAGTAYFAQNPDIPGGSAIDRMKLNVTDGSPAYSELSFGEKAQNLGIKGLKGIEKFAQQGQNASGAFGTTKAIAKAASPALTTQLGQDAVNFAKQAELDYLAELDAFNAEAGAQQEASDEGRRSAITSSMLAANFTQDEIDTTLDELGLLLTVKEGGIVSLNMGGSVLPSGREMDYRQGGMIPMGSKERADDVPARLSKNEFVMTADAVRAAGGGSVNEGAKRMYNLMNNLEARA